MHAWHTLTQTHTKSCPLCVFLPCEILLEKCVLNMPPSESPRITQSLIFSYWIVQKKQKIRWKINQTKEFFFLFHTYVHTSPNKWRKSPSITLFHIPPYTLLCKQIFKRSEIRAECESGACGHYHSRLNNNTNNENEKHAGGFNFALSSSLLDLHHLTSPHSPIFHESLSLSFHLIKYSRIFESFWCLLLFLKSSAREGKKKKNSITMTKTNKWINSICVCSWCVFPHMSVTFLTCICAFVCSPRVEARRRSRKVRKYVPLRLDNKNAIKSEICMN